MIDRRTVTAGKKHRVRRRVAQLKMNLESAKTEIV
jgi:hypothetical protein